MYVCMHVCMLVRSLCMNACLYACMYECEYLCMHVCMYAVTCRSSICTLLLEQLILAARALRPCHLWGNQALTPAALHNLLCFNLPSSTSDRPRLVPGISAFSHPKSINGLTHKKHATKDQRCCLQMLAGITDQPEPLCQGGDPNEK